MDYRAGNDRFRRFSQWKTSQMPCAARDLATELQRITLQPNTTEDGNDETDQEKQR